MNVTKNIPLDIVYIIFKYAYDYDFTSDPMKDVDVQKNIQESIPPCFLMATLPKPEFFVRSLDYQIYHELGCIMVPSPFRKGNPYYPSGRLERLFPKFSPAISTFVGLLSGYACTKNHTYKACAVRKAEQLCHATIGQWNDFYRDFFSKDFLTDPGNFYRYAYPWSGPLITTMCAQLAEAQFLLCSPGRL